MLFQFLSVGAETLQDCRMLNFLGTHVFLILNFNFFFGGKIISLKCLCLKDHNRTKRKLKKFSQMPNWLMKYDILKFSFDSKNSNIMAGNSKFKAS